MGTKIQRQSSDWGWPGAWDSSLADNPHPHPATANAEDYLKVYLFICQLFKSIHAKSLKITWKHKDLCVGGETTHKPVGK